MTNKKPQDLSITTTILAAIALIVLVILVVIYTGIFPNIYSNEQSYCKQNPDECVYYIECQKYMSNSYLKGVYTSAFGLDDDCNNEDGLVKYRKKTPQELEMEYCNENPEDGERCECDELKQPQIKEPYTIILPLHVDDVNIILGGYLLDNVDDFRLGSLVNFDYCILNGNTSRYGLRECLFEKKFNGKQSKECVKHKFILIYDGDKIKEIVEEKDYSFCSTQYINLTFYDKPQQEPICTKAQPKNRM